MEMEERMSSKVEKVFDKIFHTKEYYCSHPNKFPENQIDYQGLVTKHGYCRRIQEWKPCEDCERKMCSFVGILY